MLHTIFLDIVREILENRAEIYKALNAEVIPQTEEEEGPTHDDLALLEHIKLKDEIQATETSAQPEIQ